MSALSLRLPESIHRTVGELARQEGVSINQFVATAVAEKLAALMAADYLQERAKRGDRKAFERVLARVPAAEPEPLDLIDVRTDKNSPRAKRPKPPRRLPAGAGRRTTRKAKATDRSGLPRLR
jgi:hypothetical protein